MSDVSLKLTYALKDGVITHISKVERDRMMNEFDKIYPQYGFAKNKGYGTSEHLEALRKYGPCEIHRKSFEPIKSMVMQK